MSIAASLLLAGVAAGAEPVRLTGTELRDDGVHRALFEREGRIEAVPAGGKAGACIVANVKRRQVILDCPGGQRRLLLSESVVARSRAGLAGASADTPAVLDRSLPATPFRRALADRQGVALDVSVEPEVREGRLYGYRIGGIRPEGRFAGLGLEEGDILVALNGAPVADPSGLIQVLKGLTSAPGFECLLERDGRTRIHRYQLVD